MTRKCRFALLVVVLLGVMTSVAWAVFTPATGYEAAVAADSPDSYWKGDETSGTTLTDVIGTNNGTEHGTITQHVATGHAGAPYGFTLNGTTSSYVSMGDVLDRTGDFTYEAWVRMNSAPDYQTILSKGAFSSANGFLWGFTPARKMFYFLNWDATTICTAGTALSTGTWYDLAITHASNVYTFYVNGTSDGSCTDTRHADNTTGDLAIGQEVVNGTAYYPCDCSIAHVSDFSTALTGTRIADHATNGDNPTPPSTGGGGLTGSDPAGLLEAGWSMAVQFFAVGLLFLFIAQMLLLTVNWVRKLVG